MAEQFSIHALCQNLGVSRSGYYEHKAKAERPRLQDDQRIISHMRTIHDDGRQAYGIRRMRRELGKIEIRCGSVRTSRLMAQAGLHSSAARRFRPQTTDSSHALPVSPNLLRTEQPPTSPDKVWVSDITYLWTKEGWVYLATVMDLFSRRIVGWHCDSTMETKLIIGAMTKALKSRKPPKGLIFHSDRGSQFASRDFRHLLSQHKIVQSMSRKGNCYDNAAKESFYGRFKVECYHRANAETLRDAQLIVFDHIEGFYNPTRSHSSLNYCSPVEFENAYWNNVQKAACA